MIEIITIKSPDIKEKITIEIMNALPEWFRIKNEIVSKAVQHRNFQFYAAINDDTCVGFVALKIHNAYTAEIYNLGVRKEYHRQHIGHLLIKACIEYCQENKLLFLTVKTLDSSSGYKPYEQTRAFYKNEKFYPLEVIKHYWNEKNPCLFLVKIIGGNQNENN